jgi:hypothetical protein
MGRCCATGPTARAHPLVPHPGRVPHHSRMTGSDVAMLALTFAGFALIAMLPYAAFRLVELAEDALDRARDRA